MSETLQLKIDALDAVSPRAVGSPATIEELATWGVGIHALAQVGQNPSQQPGNYDLADSVRTWLDGLSTARAPEELPEPLRAIKTETLQLHVDWIASMLGKEANQHREDPRSAALGDVALSLAQQAKRFNPYDPRPGMWELARAGRTQEGAAIRRALAVVIFGKKLK